MTPNHLKKGVRLGVLALAVAAAVPALAGQKYILKGYDLSASDLDAHVAAAGGTLVDAFTFGVAIAESDHPGFAEAMGAVSTAVADVEFERNFPEAQFADDFGFPPNSGDDDDRFDFQWGHNFVGAQQAWEQGFRGQGVRVAVLDGGFDLDHPDLEPNINFALSADFTGEGLQYTFADPFSHGSHTAGTIAAADNGFGTIGVAPEAELVLVKVLGDAGTGSFANIIQGIVHATLADADIISMSLGTIVPRQEEGITELANAVSAAVRFAHQSGTTVIVSAGNAAHNLDGDGSLVRFMDTAEHVIPISALTTLNWAGDPENAFLVPASYTNHGVSGVDFGAPGGGVDYPGNELCQVSTRVLPCWVFDLVYSTGNGGWYWSAGTSMAAPHAAGVAALIINENGGPMHPARVKAEMRKRAVDGGKPGKDIFFGYGVANTGH